jgi:protein-(glutamine-N5) methyltransferase, release factor-specific
MSGDTNKALKILTEAGIGSEDARFDISLLFSYLGDDEKAFDEAVVKRSSGMPVAYIVGRQAFYKEEYKVTPDCLIPRADTELLVESALRSCGALIFPAGDVSVIPEREIAGAPRILDLCTGTGCVGISVYNSLIQKYPEAEVIISDISDKALEVARENIASAASSPKNIKAVKLDVLTGECEEDIGTFDVITANPPYINSADMLSLDNGVKNYEPHIALAGGEDGLTFYPAISNLALKLLKKGGVLLLEHGYDQGKSVPQTLVNTGFNNVKCLKDYGGNDRVTYGEI